MVSLGSSTWGSKPTIPISFEYEKQRSGADMQYRVKVTIGSVTDAKYFGYPIYLAVTFDGINVVNETIKSAEPNRWESDITYTSSWYAVANKTSGTTTVAFRVYSGSGSSRSQTYTYSMDVDPAASQVSAANGTLSTPLPLTVTRYNTAFTHTITYKCGTVTGTVVNKSTATTVQWDNNNGNISALAAQNTVGLSVNVTFTITTYSGSTEIGTNATTVRMAAPADAVPGVSVKVEDAAGYFATYGAYVQGWSRMKITATPALAYNSPITAYMITADGKAYSTSPVTTDVIQGNGELTVTAKVTDARSCTSDVASTDITVLEYAKPSVKVIAYRCNSSGDEDPEGEYAKVGFEATIASLNGRNAPQYSIRYGGTEIYGQGDSYLSDPLECDVSRVWSIEVTVTDNLDKSTKSAVIPIAFTLMDFYRTGMGVSLGKVATRDGFDCAMPAYFTGGVYIDEKLLADYIVDQGVTDNWTWRKWNSGIAECWCDYAHKPTAIGSEEVNITYPFNFISVPIVTATLGRNGTLATDVIACDETGNRNNSLRRCELYLREVVNAEYDIQLLVQAIGRWK